MNKKQLFLVIGIAVLLVAIPAGILLVSRTTDFKLGAQNSAEPKNVFASVNEDNQSANITWETGISNQGGVNYGISPDSMTLFRVESQPATNHSVNLANLSSGKTYYFTIKIGEKNYDNNGSPFTFTTGINSPTPPPQTSEEGGSNFTDTDFLNALGTAIPEYDINKDGIVNSMDLELSRSANPQ